MQPHPDNTVERVSRDRVTLAPNQLSADEIQERIRPTTDEELEQHTFPVDDIINLRDVIAKPNDVDQVDDERLGVSETPEEVINSNGHMTVDDNSDERSQQVERSNDHMIANGNIDDVLEEDSQRDVE